MSKPMFDIILEGWGGGRSYQEVHDELKSNDFNIDIESVESIYTLLDNNYSLQRFKDTVALIVEAHDRSVQDELR